MDLQEANEWLQGRRSMINSIPQQPLDTWIVRIAEANSNMIQCAYWIARAHNEGLVVDNPPDHRAGEAGSGASASWAEYNKLKQELKYALDVLSDCAGQFFLDDDGCLIADLEKRLFDLLVKHKRMERVSSGSFRMVLNATDHRAGEKEHGHGK
jgi:hypothetical protein